MARKSMALLLMVIQFIIIGAAATRSPGIISNSKSKQWTSETIVDSDHAARSVFNVRKYSKVDDGEHNCTEVDGTITSLQNSASRKNTNELLQFAKLQSSTLTVKGIIDGRKEKWPAEESMLLNKQRKPLEQNLNPDSPKPHKGNGAHHH